MSALEALRRSADTGPVRLRLPRKLRENEGFGLVELLIALLILTVGILALLSAYVSGFTTLRRSSRAATASTLADTQMELYRGLTYGAIAVDSSTIPTTSPYTTDSAYSASQVTTTCSGTVASNPQCNASRSVTGPDHGTYRVDTYIVFTTPASGRQVKLVTIAVRDTNNLSGRALARISSAFDESTGL
jgi:Tfp pilus assembly protein PilE